MVGESCLVLRMQVSAARGAIAPFGWWRKRWASRLITTSFRARLMRILRALAIEFAFSRKLRWTGALYRCVEAGGGTVVRLMKRVTTTERRRTALSKTSA